MVPQAQAAQPAEDWNAMWTEVTNHVTRGRNFTPRDKNEIVGIERDLVARGENVLTTVDSTRDQLRLYYWVAMHGWSTALQIKKAAKLQRDGAPIPPPQFMQPLLAPRYQPRV